MSRLTEGAAFRQLLELTGRFEAAGVQVCCVCRRDLTGKDIPIVISFPRFDLTFHVCQARCAYELGKSTAPAVTVLLAASVRPVSSGRVPVRGADARPARTDGSATGGRRKNTTPATRRAKRRR